MPLIHIIKKQKTIEPVNGLRRVLQGTDRVPAALQVDSDVQVVFLIDSLFKDAGSAS